jgi:hypothetical protein
MRLQRDAQIDFTYFIDIEINSCSVALLSELIF